MKTRRRKVEWMRGLPFRKGSYAYVFLVRDRRDPARSPRAKGGDKAPHRTIDKLSAETWAADIRRHMEDGVPRTFNRIAVELLDKTADVVFETTFDAGLWLLVEEGALEYTSEAPVFFRRTA